MSTQEPPSDRQTPPRPDRQTPPRDAPADPAVCGYCGARFVDDQLRSLHWGLEHDDQLTEAERAAYREARTAEHDDVNLFRLKALGGLLALYFGFIFVYAFVI